MSEVLDLIGTTGDFVLDFFKSILDLISTIGSSLITGFHFIIACITEIPKIINIGLFDKLPFFFSYGIYAIIGIMLTVTVFKLYQIFKFW